MHTSTTHMYACTHTLISHTHPHTHTHPHPHHTHTLYTHSTDQSETEVQKNQRKKITTLSLEETSSQIHLTQPRKHKQDSNYSWPLGAQEAGPAGGDTSMATGEAEPVAAAARAVARLACCGEGCGKASAPLSASWMTP